MGWKNVKNIGNYIKRELESILSFGNLKGCIIHIGMHKTGSSSIQATLNNFQNSKFYYAKLGNPNHSIPIYCLFSKNPESHYALSNLTKEQIIKSKIDIFDMLLKSIKQAGNRCLIISGEDICYLSESELKEFKSLLESQGNNYIKILGYVREPFGFISSAYQEILKASFIKFKELEIRVYPNYRERFEKFYKVFGEGNIILKKFDPKRFPNGDVVLDFCETIDLKISNEKIKRINQSHPKEIVSLFYILRKYYSDLPNLEFFGEKLKKLFHGLILTKFAIHPALIKPLIEKNLADIKWIEEKIGEPLLNEDPKMFEGIIDEKELIKLPDQILNRLIEFIDYPIRKNKFRPKEIAEIIFACFKKIIGEQHQCKTPKIDPTRIENNTQKGIKDINYEEKKQKQIKILKKSEIIQALNSKILDKNYLSSIKNVIPEIIDQIFYSINYELKSGRNVRIGKFGVFKVINVSTKEKNINKKIIKFIPTS